MTIIGREKIKRVINFLVVIIRRRDGQSLIEIIIALGIGALLIGAASLALVFVLRSSTVNQGLSGANTFTQDYINKVRNLGESNWQGVFNLIKGSSTPYMVVASGTVFYPIRGREGVIDNDIEKELSVRLKFDEDPAAAPTVIDFSPNKNNGSLIDAPIRSTSSCYAGNCISFDGVNDAVRILAPIVSIPTSTITVATWVYLPNRAAYDLINNNLGSFPGGWRLYATAAGQIRFAVSNSALSSVIASGCVTAFTTSTWHFAVGTYDGSTVRVYLDGVQCANAPSLSGQSLYSAGNLIFGERGAAGATTHLLDDARIYHRSFSLEEIGRLHKALPFSRYFYVENVCRANDGSFLIIGSYPCFGSVEDSSTQKIISVAEWFSGGKSYENHLVEYITRWKNKSFHQTDWSGGWGSEGPIDSPNDSFSTSSNIEDGEFPGVIRVRGI